MFRSGIYTLLLLWTIAVTAMARLSKLDFAASKNAVPLFDGSSAIPIIIDEGDNQAVHVAARTFADDVERVTGLKPNVSTSAQARTAVIITTVGSELMRRIRSSSSSRDGAQKVLGAASDAWAELEGKWESYAVRVVSRPVEGLEEAVVICGSDRRGAIYGTYALSEQMGVSPWYWWADVPVPRQSHVGYPRDLVLAHGEPTVKYRGIFLNDEQPVLWNWAKEYFKMGEKPPFQVGMYEKVFELVLRLKGNYMWPAMWDAMFAVDGQDVSNGLPSKPTPGPNQVLADRMGIVMGTSHHEPMSRNQKEFTTWGEGPWSYTANKEFLTKFWEYGAERAKGLESVYTVGMRGDGDLPPDDKDIPALSTITKAQQEILKGVNGDIKDLPQMWAMYKEVMEYFAAGSLEVPPEVTPLLADDNWGNLMAVMPEGKDHAAGGGIYYHVDYVGDPRDYKWINTVPLAKMWEQLNVANTFRTNNIWILNVGDLKLLELPAQYFLDLAYDSEAWPRESLDQYLAQWAMRDFGAGEKDAEEIAGIMATYSILASRRKAELLDSDTFSLVNFDEADEVLRSWKSLEIRAQAASAKLSSDFQVPFYETLLAPIQLYSNLNRIYISAAKSNLYATQGRTAANFYAADALAAFDRDHELTEEYHAKLNRKWDYMLCQPHIHYQYWQAPVRNAMPPVSYISKYEPTLDHGKRIHTRFTVENSLGAWPGDNKHNCPLGYNCPDPTFLPMDRWAKPAGRRVEVGAGGTQDVDFTVTPLDDWLVASPSKGHIKADGSADVQVVISVDWDKAPQNASAQGKVRFNSSDGATMTVTVPIINPPSPPKDFRGAVQGDDHVTWEAASCLSSTSAVGGEVPHEWQEVPHYGRTHSGMAVFPPSFSTFAAGHGPRLEYAFWVHPQSRPDVEIIIDIGPTLNYILGQSSAFAIQLDEQEPAVIEPVPKSKPGTLPHDWEDVVANEVRKIRIPANLATEGRKVEGEHRLSIFGMTAGIVLERISIDLGGVKAREPSYLGPPASAQYPD